MTENVEATENRVEGMGKWNSRKAEACTDSEGSTGYAPGPAAHDTDYGVAIWRWGIFGSAGS